MTFSPDGEFLYSHGYGGEVYIWDIKNQECVHKFIDDGCVKGIYFYLKVKSQHIFIHSLFYSNMNYIFPNIMEK